MPKVSVIIPCYNMEKYIERCLDSIQKQLLTDIELICIDDKSTDNTLTILKSRAEQDSRIRIIEHKSNKGVAVARNTGLDAATGEFIAFVDADDWVDIDFYEKLYNGATKNNADIAKGLLVIRETNGRRWIPPTNDYVKERKIAFCYDHTTAIFNRDFINKNQLRFLPGITLGEDACFLIKASFLANKVFITPYQTAYYYIMRDSSASIVKTISHEKTQSIYTVVSDLFEWLQNLTTISQDDYLFVTWFMFDILEKNLAKSTKESQATLENLISKILRETKFKNGTELNLCKTFNQLHKRLIGQYVIAKPFLKTIKKHDKITYAIYTKSILNKKKILLNTITIIDTPTYVKTLLFGYIPLFKRYKR